MRTLNLLSKTLFLGLFIFNAASFAAETVTLLDRGEPYASMISQNGLFWIAQNRLQFNANYRVQVYSPDGKLLDSMPLSHSISSMKEGSDGMVVMTGINPTTQLTEYTFANFHNNKIHKGTSTINVNGFINFWIGTISGTHYFADMGGNPNDDTQDMSLPAQTIFSTRGAVPQYLSTRVRMPVAGTIHNNKLLMVSSQGMGSTKASVVEVDPQTQQQRTLITTTNGQFANIKMIPGTNNFVTNAKAINKLIVAESTTGKVIREIQTRGYTRAFTFTGHCILAGNDGTNSIEVFDLNSTEDKSVLTTEIGMATSEFSGIKQIAIDSATGVIFAAAAYPCNPMTGVCDQDYNRVVTLGTEVGNSIKAQCN